ncbi:MAG: NADH-quinone oxidoreductase subunit NuoE [bacterium]|nr:MAG: NADH-quinone oxidoreductase subunit NuoE [bacterium]
MIKKTDQKVGAVLVVGAGVGGMQASLDLAEAGYNVYLVEKGPSIGGVMAQLDKTFPTNDCAMCTLAPRMVDCGGHLNIEKLTYSEVESIEGEAGNFRIRVRKKPRFINEDKCTGCGTCTTNCPVLNIAHFEDVDELGKVQLKEEDRQIFQQILSQHDINRESIIAVLQDINNRYRYLPDDILRHVAAALNVPLSLVYSLATFYNAFSLVPRGKYVIRVCMGTACHVQGGHQILQGLERMLNVPVGGTTEDMNFSLEEVRCLGCCGLAPVITINEDLYGSVTQAKLPKILKRYREEEVSVGIASEGVSDAKD